MGIRSRRTGQRYESEALKWFQELGFTVRKSAASGAVEGYVGDLELELAGRIDIEVKYSSVDRGCGIIRRYLEPCDLVMLRAPGEQWMFVLTPELMKELLVARGDLELLQMTEDAKKPVEDAVPDGPHEGGWNVK